MKPVYLYKKKISDFVLMPLSDILDDLKNNYFNEFQKIPDVKQINAWSSSLKYFIGILETINIQDLYLLLEFKLPLEGDIVDAILVGKNSENKLVALIIEFKGWKRIEFINNNLVNCDLGENILSPDIQIASYVGYLEFSSSAANYYIFKDILIMYNLLHTDCKFNFKHQSFLKNQENNVIDFLNDLFFSSATEEELKLLADSSYEQNYRLMEFVKENKDQILCQSMESLADKGFKFSNEQLILISEIENSISNNEEVTYLISGSPGSGKTLLAINLLLSSIAKGHDTVLAIMNNRLFNSLENVLGNVNGKNIKSILKYFSIQDPKNPGVADNEYSHRHKVVIYDESQRMNSTNISNCFKKAMVNIIFYDETQRLNYDERGKFANFNKIALDNNYKIIVRNLNGAYRVRGGKEYHNWLEDLLANPSAINHTSNWNQNYEFESFSSFNKLISLLEKKVNNNKVAILASWTETYSGLRIGPKIANGIYDGIVQPITWIKENNENTKFFVNGECNELKKCASIYGCQGFEADYIGFIWGRDLVIRNGEWVKGSNSEDKIKRAIPSFKDLFNDPTRYGSTDDVVLELLKNRARIFLTRGIKGTYIFCEDIETRKYFKNICKPNNLE